MSKNITLLFALLLLTTTGKSQRPSCYTNTSKAPFCRHFQMPEFEGGEEALYRYLAKNIHYPDNAREYNIDGKVIVHFTIRKDGIIDDVLITQGIGGGCDEEAARVVRSLPHWKPARHKRKNVPFTETLPIVFRLE